MKGFVNYTYTASLAIGYGGAPAVKHLRFEDVNFVANHNKFAIWIQLTPAYFTGRGYSSGAKFSQNAPLDDFRFVNCTFENDGGHVYIDGGENPLTNFAFENCTFYKTTKPSLMMGQHVAPGPVQERQDQRSSDPECRTVKAGRLRSLRPGQVRAVRTSKA